MQVQGIDYAYTLQGWLKGVNSTSVGDGTSDMGGDGKTGSSNSLVARDAFGFSLNYFGADYKPIGAAINGTIKPFLNSNVTGLTNTNNLPVAKDLYNGNIASMFVNIPIIGDGKLYAYRYDQLNRLKQMDMFNGFTNSTNEIIATASEDYQETIEYDPDGNINKYHRNGAASTGQLHMDELEYSYWPNTNQLKTVGDGIPDSYYANDIDDQSGNPNGYNYKYDEIGNLIEDVKEGIRNIDWNVYGKINYIEKWYPGSTTNSYIAVSYTYDASGNRISKFVHDVNDNTDKTTWYVRDASGNVMSVYEFTNGQLFQKEIDLYGSSRLGIYNVNTNVDDWNNVVQGTDIDAPVILTDITDVERGAKFFELSNHLGNVLATVTDKRIQHSSNNSSVDYYMADIGTANDYYPGGMEMPGRKFSTANFKYRYGFQKQEIDDELNTNENIISFKCRVEDSRLGRFFSTDPLIGKYPFNSPYAFSQNRVIDGIELEGAEVLLIGKQESASFFLGGFSEVGVAIGPNGVYGYGTGGIGICTSTSVATGLAVTFYPTMPTVQDAGGISWAASGSGGEVGYVGGGPVYCGGYWGLTVIGGIGGSIGLLSEFGGATVGGSGSYTWFTPLSEFAKKAEARELFGKAKTKLKEIDNELRGKINDLNTKNQKLSSDNNELSKNSDKSTDSEKKKLQNKINNNLKAIDANQNESKKLSKRLTAVDQGIQQIDTELNKK